MILIYMNRLILNRIHLNEVKLCVFDMAGTVVQENGIVYDTLYETSHTYPNKLEHQAL